jgi:peptidoglycan DL-endopeptidase CwlO
VASSFRLPFLGTRSLLSIICSLGVFALVLGLAPGAQAAPKPTVASVTAQLHKLDRQNERLSEQYNKAGIDVAAKQKKADQAAGAATKARNAYLASARQVRLDIIDQYKGGGLETTAALLTSHSSQNYLDQLSTLSLMSSRRVTITALLHTQKLAASKTAATARSLVADATKNRKALGVARVNLKAQVAKYTKLLNQLNAAQRAKLLLIQQTKIKSVAQAPVTKSQRNAQVKFAKATAHAPSSKSQGRSATASPAPAPSSRAGVAVSFALAQIGKPYVFAAAGPGAYDCSGLTMAAWGKAGVQLPHLARAQFGMGHAVSKSQLQPGDLVFFYSGIGHVAMYIGHGMVVHAPHTGDVVRIAPLSQFGSAYQGARRF